MVAREVCSGDNKRYPDEKAEAHIRRLLEADASPKLTKLRKEMPTFEDWFLGR